MREKYQVQLDEFLPLLNKDSVVAMDYRALAMRIASAGTQVTMNFFNALFRDPGKKANGCFKAALPKKLMKRGRGWLRVHPMLLRIVDDGLTRRWSEGMSLEGKVRLPKCTWENINSLGEAVREADCRGTATAWLDLSPIRIPVADKADTPAKEEEAKVTGATELSSLEADAEKPVAAKPAGACDRLNKPATFAERVDDGCCCSAEEDDGSSAGRNEALEVAAAAMQIAVDEFPLEAVAYIDSLYTWAHSESVRMTLKSGKAGKLREKAEDLGRQLRFWDGHEHASKVIPFIEEELRKTVNALNKETESLRVPGFDEPKK